MDFLEGPTSNHCGLIAVLQARGAKHRKICTEGQFKILFDRSDVVHFD